ncbi:MAG TPA: hypothetical protein VE377_22635 [Candidatus Dormibacteraeota bacterium]|nr:hypothetical protein [Candidatus Dormibacteraeota bacterium]
MRVIRLAYLCVILCIAGVAQTPIETQAVKELKPTGSLGTCGYTPSSNEKPYYEKLDQKERATGSFMEAYDIHKKKDVFVSWYGIVRGVTRIPNSDSWELLLEHKYFDGMTDCHIMLVSMGGSGDFSARVQAKDVPMPALALVRVYGKVTQENTTPLIEAEFVRVWPWMTFTFTDMGAEDKTNARWKKECKLCEDGRVYRPYPDRRYYRKTLGDPEQYGVLLK